MDLETRNFEVKLIKNRPDLSLLELQYNQEALQRVILQAEQLQSAYKSRIIIQAMQSPKKAVPEEVIESKKGWFRYLLDRVTRKSE